MTRRSFIGQLLAALAAWRMWPNAGAGASAEAGQTASWYKLIELPSRRVLAYTGRAEADLLRVRGRLVRMEDSDGWVRFFFRYTDGHAARGVVLLEGRDYELVPQPEVERGIAK